MSGETQTRAQRRALEKLLAKFKVEKHWMEGNEIFVDLKDGDQIAIQPNGLAAPR